MSSRLGGQMHPVLRDFVNAARRRLDALAEEMVERGAARDAVFSGA